MEDRWTVYIRENAKKRNIPNPWLKSKQSEGQALPPSQQTDKAS